MADNPSLQVEARLKDFMTRELKTLEENIKTFSEKGKQDFAVVEKSSKTMFTGVKDSLLSFAKQFGPAAIATGLLTKGIMELRKEMEFIKTSTETFQHSMNVVRALMNPTSNEFAALSDRAKELGEITKFTAGQVADAFTVMAQSGLKANEIFSVSPAVLDLATIAGTSMAQATEVVTGTLSQFGHGAEMSSHLVDLMATSFTKSKLNMDRFSESMKYAGTLAGSLGIPMEDTVAALELLSSKMIVGTRAGTGMLNTMSQLYQPTSKVGELLGITANDTRTFGERLEDLSKKGIAPGEMMQLFGLEAGKVAITLVDGVKQLKVYRGELDNVEDAGKRMSSMMRDDIVGATDEAKSAHEGMAIAIGEAFGDSKMDRLKFTREMYIRLTEVVKSHQDVLSSLGIVLTATFKVIFTIGEELITTVVGITDAVRAVINATATGISAFVEDVAKAINFVSKMTTGKNVFGEETIRGLEDSSDEWARRTIMNAQNVSAAFLGTKYAIKSSGAAFDATKAGRGMSAADAAAIDAAAAAAALDAERQAKEVEARKDFLKKQKSEAEQFQKEMASLSVAIVKDEIEKVGILREQQLLKIAEYENAKRITAQQGADYRLVVETNFTNNVEKITQDRVDKEIEAGRKLQESENKRMAERLDILREFNAEKNQAENDIEQLKIQAMSDSDEQRRVQLANEMTEKIAHYESLKTFGVISEQQLADAKAAINTDYNNKMAQQDAKVQQMKVAIFQSSTSAIINVLGMLGKKNKALAVAGKIVATGQAAINAYLAATSAAAQAPVFLKTATFASQLALGLSGAAAIAATPLARGTDNFPGGMALVGERGPEIMQLPQGASVTPAEQTRRIMSQSSTTINLNIAPGATVDRVAAQSITSRLEEMNDLLRMGQSNGMIRLNEIMARGA